MSAKRVRNKKQLRFGWDNPPETAGNVEKWLSAPWVDNRLGVVRATPKQCALCGSTPDLYGVYFVTDAERARWHADWCGFALCIGCASQPDAKLRLKKRFEFEMDNVAGLPK
jgi:hypothetical protein